MFEPSQQSEGSFNTNLNRGSDRSNDSFPVFNVIIVILLVLNLSATVALLIDNLSSDSDNGDTESSISSSLPDSLKSSEAKLNLFNSLVQPYNDQDSDALYDKMGALMKTEVSRQDFSEQLEILYDMSGKITNGTYSHYETLPDQYGMSGYVLYYSADINKGPCQVKITVYQQDDDPYQVVGFRFDL